MLKHIIPMARASVRVSATATASATARTRVSATASARATNTFILNAGTIQLNKRKYMHKNVNLYKSPEWLYCNVLVHNSCYKRIYAEELTHGQAYDIKMVKCNALPSLLCGDGIVYQRDAWFSFKLEFILNLCTINSVESKSPTKSAFISSKGNSYHALEKCAGVNECLGAERTFNNIDGNKVFFEIYLNEINNYK